MIELTNVLRYHLFIFAQKEEAAENINNARAQATTKAKGEYSNKTTTENKSIFNHGQPHSGLSTAMGHGPCRAWLSRGIFGFGFYGATHLIIDNLSMISEEEEEENNSKHFKNGKCCTIFKSQKKQKFALPSLSLSLTL